MGTHTATVDEPVVDHALPHHLVEQALSPTLEAAHDAVERLAAWADARRLHIIQALRTAGRSPLELIDDQSVHTTVTDMSRAERRADIAARFPEFATALERGDVSAAHLDRLGEALRRLLPHEADLLAADHARLLLTARAASAGRFGRFLTREVARFERLRPAPEPDTAESSVDPAEARFAAQQTGIRLSSQLDRDTGMTIWRLALDPLRSLSLERRIAARVETLHHGPPIPGCHTDPFERQAFLRALALLQLLEESASDFSPAGAEIIVVVDHTTPDGTPDVDWGRPVDIPQRVLDDLLGHPATKVNEVVVRNGVVVTAPGQFDLGRSTRLANRAQRRALRALYRGCGVPGCDVTFDRCKIHHIQWWRHGGATDLANLLPLCHRHHHLVHDGGWQLHLGPNRELTVTTPSGRVMTTGPPRRWAA